MGYSRITADLTLVAMTGVSSLASAALSPAQEARCEAFASLHYALAYEASVDTDGAYEDAYAGCSAGWVSFCQDDGRE